jgi:dTDP-4-dehydrorhamnose reductase
MRVLLTGGSGLLAINWAQEILSFHTVALVEHLTPIDLSGVEKYKISEISEIDFLKIFQEFKPDIVINTIALTSVEECELNPTTAYYVNVEIAKVLARTCQKNGIKIVHISTDHLYDGSKSMLSEDDLISPINNYAITKAKAEEVVLQECNNGLVIRTNFYGPGLSYRDSFASKIVKSLASNVSIDLFHNVFYTPILMKILVSCVHKLIAGKAKGVFNVSSNERISKYEFGILLAHEFNFDQALLIPIGIRDRKDLVRRPTDMSLSNKKLCKFLKMSMPSLADQIKIFKEQINQ